MQQRFIRLRKGWSALAVCALVASLLAAAASTATATTDTPDETSDVTACVGAAKADWGFYDVSAGNVHRDSINCLAHYGITIGCGDGTNFCPEQPIKRWQMMLFLVRALGPAGINLRAARAQNFTDLGGLNREARNAIDLLVTNGIATAGSSRAFDPNGIVDRTEMAQLLVRLLDAAGSVVNFDSSGNILLDANGDGAQRQADDYFKDARDSVPAAADKAISAAYELGITTGAGPTPTSGAAQPGLDFYYRPRAQVTRGQMASFVIRTLGHTLARPRGVSAQYDGSELRVSVRNDSLRPVNDEPIDAFYVETRDESRAFGSNGACADIVMNVDGVRKCEIDSSDLRTDDMGEVSLTVPQPILDGTATTVWVWTGGLGARVGQSTDLVKLNVTPSAETQGAASAKISTTYRGSKARFGTTVTFTVQLQDANGRAIAAGVNGKGPAEWTLTESLLSESADSVNGLVNDGEGLLSRTPRTVRSDSNGRFTFSLSVADPDAGSVGQSRTRAFRLVPKDNAPTTIVSEEDRPKKTTSGGQGVTTTNPVYFLEFSDAEPVLANSVARVTVPSLHVKAPFSGSARNTATVSVYNEYGEALPNATAVLASSRTTATSLTARAFRVGRDGIHRFSYSYSGPAGVETLTATVDPDGTGDATALSPSPTATVLWSAPATAASQTTRVVILFGDISLNEIVVDTNTGGDNPGAGANNWPNNDVEPRRVRYDGNDRFDVAPATAGGTPVPVQSIEEFERALAPFLAKTPSATNKVGACLEWSKYSASNPSAVAEFKLTRMADDATNCPSG